MKRGIAIPFLLPFILVACLGLSQESFAQVVETQGENYDLVENFNIGEASWVSHPDRIMDGSWKNYVLTDTNEKVIFNSNAVGSLIFDKNSCSYSIYGNGFDGEQIIPSVSAVATYLNNGQWQNLPINDESCIVEVSEYEDGVYLTSTKVITEDVTEDVFIDYTGTTENFYVNATNANFDLVQSSNGTNIGYYNGETITTTGIEVEKFVQELRLDINSGFKETFKVWHDGDESLGISQTVHTGESITIGDQTINIAELNGQSFDRQFIIDNEAEILAITDSVNYDFDTGIESLSNVNIIFDSTSTIPYKVNMDYADGGFVGYLEIDPTFTTTGSGTFDVSTIWEHTIASGTIDGTPLTSTQITNLQNDLNAQNQYHTLAGTTLVVSYTVNTAPDAPTGLTTVTGMPIETSWTAPTDDGGSSITGYKVFRTLNEFSHVDLPDNSGSDGQITFTDNELLIHGFPISDSSTNSIALIDSSIVLTPTDDFTMELDLSTMTRVNVDTAYAFRVGLTDTADATNAPSFVGFELYSDTSTNKYHSVAYGNGITDANLNTGITRSVSYSTTHSPTVTITKSGNNYSTTAFGQTQTWTSNSFNPEYFTIYSHYQMSKPDTSYIYADVSGLKINANPVSILESDGAFYGTPTASNSDFITWNGDVLTVKGFSTPDRNVFSVPFSSLISSTSGTIGTAVNNPDLTYSNANLPSGTSPFSVGGWVKLTASSPVNTPFYSQTTENDGLQMARYGSSSDQRIGQKITSSSNPMVGNTLDELTVKLKNNWSATGYNIYANVWDSSGNARATSTAISVNNIANTYTDYTFSFSSPVTINNGDIVGVSTDGGTLNSSSVNPKVHTSNPESDGQMYSWRNGAWFTNHFGGSADLYMVASELVTTSPTGKLLGINGKTFTVAPTSASVDESVIVPAQGYDGGAGGGSGGGGAGGVGGGGQGQGDTGIGGIGITSTITGSSIDYAGGGGGKFAYHIWNHYGSATHGGGASSSSVGGAGVDGKGGGGGGGGYNYNGGKGGDGVLILSFDSSVGYSTVGSPTIDTTSVTGKTILTYSAGSGGFTLNSDTSVEYLLIAGGGGGGRDGYSGVRFSNGGGAGGVLQGTSTMTANTYSITVGTGGAGGAGNAYNTTTGQDGGDSTFNGMTSVGGGGGLGHGSAPPYTIPARDGGSGAGMGFGTPATTSTSTIISATSLTDNTSTPQHYAFTRDSSNLWTIYQNGASAATATDSVSLGSNVGNNYSTKLSGTLDEYFINSDVLTATEIDNIYDRGVAPTLLTTVTATEYDDNTVVVTNTYYYSVQSVNAIGSSDYLTPFVSGLAGSPPDPPTITGTSIASPNVAPLDITIDWSSPLNTGTAGITNYEIYRDATLITTVGNVNTYTDTVPTGGGTFVYSLKSITSHGTSTLSGTASQTTATPPPAPTSAPTLDIANPNPSPLDVTVSFALPSSGGSAITSFEIFRSTDDITYTSVGTTSNLIFYDTVPNAGLYHYKFASTNLVGTGSQSPSSNITTANEPDAITDLATSAITDTTATLTWTAPNSNGSDIVDYTLYRDGVLISTSATTGFSDTGLITQTSYDYTVYARNNVGLSLISNSVTQVTDGVAGVVPLTATTAAMDQINLTWTEPNNYNSAITNYIIERESPTGGGFTTLITLGSVLSYSDGSLTAVTEYNYRITAVNGYGNGATSTSSAITLPAPPTNLTVNDCYHTCTTQLNLEWVAPVLSTGVNGYKITFETPVGGGFSTLVANTTTTTLYYNHTGLVSGQFYNYKVQTLTAVGESQVSNAYSYSPHKLPDSVDDLVVTTNSLLQFILNWSVPDNLYGTLSGYMINYTTPAGDPTTIYISDSGSPSTTSTISGFDPTVEHSFRVSAVTTHGTNATLGNISNGTITSEILIGSLTIDSSAVNPDVVPIWYVLSNVDANTDEVDVYFKPSSGAVDCTLTERNTGVETNYTSIAETVDGSNVFHTFTVTNAGNGVAIDFDCWDSTDLSINEQYALTQADASSAFGGFGNVPMFSLMANYTSGLYGTDGEFAGIDLITLFIVIVSMLFFNRTNPALGVGGMAMMLGVAWYFEVIPWTSGVLGGIAVVLVLALGQGLKNR